MTLRPLNQTPIDLEPEPWWRTRAWSARSIAVGATLAVLVVLLVMGEMPMGQAKSDAALASSKARLDPAPPPPTKFAALQEPVVEKETGRLARRRVYAADLPRVRARSDETPRTSPTVDLDDDRNTASDQKANKLGEISTPAAAGDAAPARPLGPKIDYVAVNQNVADVMRELGQAAGQRVVTNPAIKSTIRQRRFQGHYATLMQDLAQEYNLFWFADGGVAYVDPIEEQTTKVVKLKNVSGEEIAENLDSMGLGHLREKVQVVPGEGAARVTGPESFQKVIENLLASLEPAGDPDIKIFKYGARIK